MVDSLTQLIQDKLMKNKKADIIIDALNVSWNMKVRYPKVGFFGDNGCLPVPRQRNFKTNK